MAIAPIIVEKIAKNARSLSAVRRPGMTGPFGQRANATLHSVRFFGLVLCFLASLPATAGQLGVTYAIPILYVPLLMITHIAGFYLLLRPRSEQATASNAAAPQTSGDTPDVFPAQSSPPLSLHRASRFQFWRSPLETVITHS